MGYCTKRMNNLQSHIAHSRDTESRVYPRMPQTIEPDRTYGPHGILYKIFPDNVMFHTMSKDEIDNDAFKSQLIEENMMRRMGSCMQCDNSGTTKRIKKTTFVPP